MVRLSARIRAEHPGLPLVLFGHSMGSFATQQFLVDHSDDVDAVVLSGTTEVSGLVPLLDSPEPADLSAFNAGFEHRTGFEWLSGDPDEVDKYVADEGCGFASDPFRGIPTLLAATDPERLARIRSDLPILLVSGSADPLAGGGAAVELVGQRYRDAGVRDVTVLIYPGAGHELLNDTNRDEVTADNLAFIGRAVGGCAAHWVNGSWRVTIKFVDPMSTEEDPAAGSFGKPRQGSSGNSPFVGRSRKSLARCDAASCGPAGTGEPAGQAQR